jgi:hypothetical protein
MVSPMKKLSGCVLFPLALLTFVGGCVTGGLFGANRATIAKNAAVYAPLPHSVPPSPDATPFKFAMVHDVIHERYPRNGPAYYEERERLAREKMRDFHPESETAFALTDDIAVGLDRRGRTDEAIAMMRDKLKRQQRLNLEKKDLYSSYANLGEFVLHGNLWAMMGGDAAAKVRAKEGLEFLRKSKEANSNAHFGREGWQIVAIKSLIDGFEDPVQVRQYDLIGNALNIPVEIRTAARPSYLVDDFDDDVGRPYMPRWSDRLHESRWTDYSQEEVAKMEGIDSYRKYVTHVGGRKGIRAPFDEPAMWLIGEWRQGSGPNPHYALCLGEIMLRVGQRYLAWNCYERASRMADQFWPTPEMQQFLRDHCKSRQTAIEESLSTNEVAELRPKFDKELAFGEAYQRDYQAYADEKIQAGANLNDPHFFDEFHEKRGPIASQVGPEEWYAGSRRGGQMEEGFKAFWLWGILSGGASVLLIGVVMTLYWRKRKSTANGHA